MSTTNLLQAIRIVKENERIAMDSYADAANKISHVLGKQLFMQLSEFEKYHYEKLSTLEQSLEKDGGFIKYEGKEFPHPPTFEIKAAQELNQKSLMAIISDAMDLEKVAEEAYADLAKQIEDPQGRQMFLRLSEEEHNHYRILMEAYWSLNTYGIWKWSRV